ncbi:MAG: AAA family ATPase [Alphaproteobacteria bacterium]|nr:AAA family ATPase [Alphaproteobacteria bacterium]
MTIWPGDNTVSVRDVFNIESDWEVPAFAKASEHVPAIDPDYYFDRQTTLAILAGFAHNRRVLVQGYHGTGKSTHIEQIAARLNWPCIRVNLDGQISRIDLIGKDGITVKEGKQITEFRPGIIPWSMERPVALVFDEYDAARPDVMFVIQRLLEQQGALTLLDQNRVIQPHPGFRLFATANTIGLGDSTGLYHGTQLINQGQMDRWNIATVLHYLPQHAEETIITQKIPALTRPNHHDVISKMVTMANLTREGFKQQHIASVMSTRTIISWAENYLIFADLEWAFCLSFLNKCDEVEQPIIAEYYQRCFGKELILPSTTPANVYA